MEPSECDGRAGMIRLITSTIEITSANSMQIRDLEQAGKITEEMV